MSSTDILPNPIFEGSEKRFEIHFSIGPKAPPEGLRALSRATLDELMTLAACEIVSHTSNSNFDSYVLSESSLFVYPSFLVIKTCGTTKLLNILQRLLEVTAQINVLPERCKYSRASFLYPDLQPALYQNFDAEIGHIRAHLGHIGNGGSAFVLGDKLHGLQWHVYVLDVHGPSPRVPARFNLEVCMTDLTQAAREQFYRTPDFVSSSHTTDVTGIRGLAPNAVMDDYVFEPCGYSMNGIEGEGYITIHVTPEEAFSYASCELFGFPEDSFDALEKAAAIAAIFQPGRMVVTFTVDTPDANCQWGSNLVLPGYGCASATCQVLANGSRVWFYSLVKDDFSVCPRTNTRPLVMSHWPSFSTLEYVEVSSDGGDGSAPLPQPHSNLHAHALATLGPLTKRGRHFSPTESGSSGSEMGRESAHSGASHATGDVGGVLAGFAATALPSSDPEAVAKYSAQVIQEHGLEDTFFVVDLSRVGSLVGMWRDALPRVTPLCHVKPGADRAILTMLGVLGCGFAVSNAAEADLVTDLAVDVDVKRVMLTSVKHPRDLRSAKAHGVPLVVCSSVAEMQKIARFHPHAQLMLHVSADAEGGLAPLLVAALASSGLRIAGVTVDCAGGADAFALVKSIAAARAAFDQAAALGHAPSVLHIGTSFALQASKGCAASLGDAPATVNEALAMHFPAAQFPELRVFAEAGGLFFEPASHMVSMVHGVRVSGGGDLVYEVTDCPVPEVEAAWISEDRDPMPLRPGSPATLLAEEKGTALVSAADDAVTHKAALPAMAEGDWLLYPFRGCCAAGNGHRPSTFYVARPEDLRAAAL